MNLSLEADFSDLTKALCEKYGNDILTSIYSTNIITILNGISYSKPPQVKIRDKDLKKSNVTFLWHMIGGG